MKKNQSALYQTVCNGTTQLWVDSCSQEALHYAISHGAVGATTNPIIVGEVLKSELPLWQDRIIALIMENPTSSEDDIAWKLIAEMATKGAKLLAGIFQKENGKKGRLSIQTNAKFYRSSELMLQQALEFHQLAPNMQVKIPATRAGLTAIENATFNGVSVNATVCFTVAQAIAVAKAVERGLNRREQIGQSISGISPVCTIMVGRLDDWIKVEAAKTGIQVNPGILEWCGIAVMKNAYTLFRQHQFRTRLLAAAFRNHMHWSEFMGGDIILTIPYEWQKKFNASDIAVIERMDNPVAPDILTPLLTKFEEFRKAYYPEGLTPEEFDSYGATVRTLKSFLKGYDDLLGVIREFMLPNPDKF